MKIIIDKDERILITCYDVDIEELPEKLNKMIQILKDSELVKSKNT